MIHSSTEGGNRLAPTFLLWVGLCVAAILFLFVPLDGMTRAALSLPPLSLQPNNTVLLLRALKIAIPLLGTLCLAWLGVGSPIRHHITGGLLAILDARLTVPVLVAVTVLLQLVWLTYYPTQLYADSQWYYDKAIDLANGRGYVYDLQSAKPTAAWPVGYPAVLALIFKITKPSLLAAKLANVMLAGLAVTFTYLVARRMFEHRVGVVAALWMAVLPGLVVYSSLVASDILFLVLVLCVLWLALVDERRLGLTDAQAFFFALLIGILTGIMTLVRSTGLVILPFVGVIHWLVIRTYSTDLKAMRRWLLVLGIGTSLVVLPWTLRNYVHFHRFILVSTNGGENFWMGNNPLATGGYTFPRDPAHNPLLNLLGDEVAVDETGYRLGLEFLKQNPARALALLPAKIFYLYYANDDGLEWDLRSAVTPGQPGGGAIAHAGINLAYILLLLSACAGVLVSLAQRKVQPPVIWIGVAFACVWTLAHLPFFGTNRFALPVLPFLATYSAYGLLSLIQIDRPNSI
jgi:4-amino-4-deoxy-L-arabinose transferase-like glycosyltransferase